MSEKTKENEAEATANGSPKPTSPNADLKHDFASFWNYSPAPESSDFVEIREQYQHYIDGSFSVPAKKRYFKSINPATEEVLAEFAEGTSEDVDKAVKAARKAYDKVWSKLPPRERGKYIYRIARMIQERARELAIIESMDGGKPIRESRDVDVPSGCCILLLLCRLGR